jgi:hypothetical protein
MSTEAVIIILIGQVISTAATIGWLRATINGTRERVTKVEDGQKDIYEKHNICSMNMSERVTKLEAQK